MDILCEIRNQIAFLTLNRPAALNALSLAMITQLRTALNNFSTDPQVKAVFIKGAGEKAFCAGGDIRAIYESYQQGTSLHLDFFAAEYPLDYQLHCYPKPYIAMIDGIAMGGGMGVAQGSRLRIVGDRTRMAMPEVAIGFFPDVGASFFLSRLPGSLGLYLALTGVQIRAADTVYVGLADEYLPRDSIDRLETELASLAWSGDRSENWRADIQGLLRRLANADPGPAPLAAVRTAIDQHFAAPNVPALLASLEGERRSEYVPWAQQTLALINARSPTLLAVVVKQLQRGRNLSLADCLRMEFAMVRQCFAQGDFIEGIRAMVIDKDNNPSWQPKHLAQVTDAAVDAIFQDSWAGAAHPLANLEGVHS